MILGLDLGTASIGWALITTDESGAAKGLLDVGVRCFNAGVAGDLESGREEPRNLPRREARQARRMNWRRGRRHRTLVRRLQSVGLLPDSKLDPVSLDAMFKALDSTLKPASLDHRQELVWHYGLRAAALDRKLKPHELGRAVVHLVQRRGFKSNRKDAMQPDEDLGLVKESILELDQAMKKAGHRTVGEHFANLDPDRARIRRRWLGRMAIEAEFDFIMDSQRTHHPSLTDEVILDLRRIAFFQRPLKPVESGRCSLETGERRCRLALLDAQRFRVLQGVNNLQVRGDGPDRPLTDEERATLIAVLDVDGDLTWGKVRKTLVLKKVRFNLEDGGAPKMIGNRTAQRLRGAFTDRWEALTENEKDAVVEDVLGFEKVEPLRKRAKTHWKLDSDAADLLTVVKLEPGYASLSRAAIRRFIPKLRDGQPYATARKALYPEQFEAGTPRPNLRPVQEFEKELRNPTVERTLTELRRVVNGIIRKHGRPDDIRIELGRDLKRSRKDRVRMTRENRSREKDRDDVRNEIKTHAGIGQPNGRDLLKARLADECNWICPFTGRPFGWADLFGGSPSVDIEHLIPFSRSLDDSYINKTLCFNEENRNVKGNRTPFEAYHATSKWDEILERVGRFKGDAAGIKLKRFLMSDSSDEIFDEFATRQLNDTRYASRLACEYLGELFGGRVDSAGKTRIHASTGGATAHLRRGLLLEGILSSDDRPFKNREDHRHHAVDAVAIALTDRRMVNQLARSAEDAWSQGRRRSVTQIAEPWPGFMASVRASIEGIIVSHRTDHRLGGQLHQETNYSNERNGGLGVRRTQRKPLEALKSAEVGKIVDPVLRARVQAELVQRGGDPKKAFGDPGKPMILTGSDGRPRRLRRVRVEAAVKPTRIGPNHATRWVKPGSNHHMAIFEVDGKKGPKWEAEVVTMLEAIERRRRGVPVIDRREHVEGSRFVCSLRSGDSVLLDLPDEGPTVCTVNTVSGSTVEFRRHSDARKALDIRRAGVAGGRLLASASSLKSVFKEKIDVLPLGDLRTAHD